MQGFMKRHGNLSFRKPENTGKWLVQLHSIRPKFPNFENYVKEIKKYKFEPNRTFNVDETGITTVLQAPKIDLTG